MDSNLFADFRPGLLQPVDGAAIESRGDLQHSVVVIEAATNISNRQPLFDGAGPGADVSVGHYLRCHQVTHLCRERERETTDADENRIFFKPMHFNNIK